MRESDDIQRLLLKMKTREYRRLLRINNTTYHHLTLIADNDDHRVVRMRGLIRYNAFHVELKLGDLAAAVALENGQFLKIVHHHEMMTPRTNEVDELIPTAVVQVSLNVWCGVFALGESHLHEVALNSVVKDPIVSERVRDQDVRLADRFDIPLFAPEVFLWVLLKVADLAEGRSEDYSTSEPADRWHLDVQADSATLRSYDATNVGAVVAAQVYVTVSVRDGQQRIVLHGTPIDPVNRSVGREFHFIIFAMDTNILVETVSIFGDFPRKLACRRSDQVAQGLSWIRIVFIDLFESNSWKRKL